MLYYFYPFKFTEVCFVAYHMVSPRECSLCAWKSHGVSCCWVECFTDLWQVSGFILFKSSVFLLVFCLVVPFSMDNEMLMFVTVHFCYFFFHTGSIYVYNCFFLMDWPFYHYKTFLFASVNWEWGGRE
jgi:hypothetical protein